MTYKSSKLSLSFIPSDTTLPGRSHHRFLSQLLWMHLTGLAVSAFAPYPHPPHLLPILYRAGNLILLKCHSVRSSAQTLPWPSSTLGVNARRPACLAPPAGQWSLSSSSDVMLRRFFPADPAQATRAHVCQAHTHPGLCPGLCLCLQRLLLSPVLRSLPCWRTLLKRPFLSKASCNSSLSSGSHPTQVTLLSLLCFSPGLTSL